MALCITAERGFRTLRDYYKPGNTDVTWESTQIRVTTVEGDLRFPQGTPKPRGDSTCPELQPVSGRGGMGTRLCVTPKPAPRSRLTLPPSSTG